jgi:hypothetical protein
MLSVYFQFRHMLTGIGTALHSPEISPDIFNLPEYRGVTSKTRRFRGIIRKKQVQQQISSLDGRTVFTFNGTQRYKRL